uniref:NADH dehydrogenase subunit 1 n=1 Tax=Cipangopaludina longispira TaxID=889207 RepID=UPI001D0FEBF0|nr:NADH dehydrogenase subunit 1 [Cipangopaludina longispira]UDD73403.1 NADH dehydrogenase subunit 1 [Cipangopaludina longispira]
MIISLFSCGISYICVLLAVAFFTFLERKGLSYMQLRKGPNKVGFIGVPQPIADAAKLLTKEIVKPIFSNYFLYLGAPVFSFSLALLLWQLYPGCFSIVYFKWGVLFFLCVSSLNVYGTLLAGWSSNSKYALIGSLRAVAQTISYEVSMVLIFLFPLFLAGSFSFFDIKDSQGVVWFIFLMCPISFLWFVSCVAETNRAPFDFAEGESELVSGFNVEYGAAGFALIFLAEYANILVMSLFSVVLFLGGPFLMVLCSDFVMMVKVMVLAFLFIWIRASYPRFRYDFLMNLTWKLFLPIALVLLLFLLVMMFNLFL